MSKNTIIISAFPACGKTYYFNNHKEDKVILDSDSSGFSWIKDENGNNTKERNPLFPNNYIEHIKSCMGKADIIFVSSHLIVRQALKDANIEYVTVYPDENCREEWIDRCIGRNNNEAFIKFIDNNWNNFMRDIHNEPYGKYLVRLNKNQCISDIIDEIIEGK